MDGCCLTVARILPDGFTCALSSETLRCTRAGTYRLGTQVNLERALRLSDRLGGHFVMGHVDQSAYLQKKRIEAEFWELDFGGVNHENMAYLAPKGSVAVQGVSLTINEIAPEGFRVMLIPHTLQKTNLSDLKEGDRINLEFDWMTKVLVREARARLDLREPDSLEKD